jgi:hypothetical protein
MSILKKLMISREENDLEENFKYEQQCQSCFRLNQRFLKKKRRLATPWKRTQNFRLKSWFFDY